MAQFNWVSVPPNGPCVACGGSVNDRGFVDMIGEVVVKNSEGEFQGVADVYYCATCIEQASRIVGCATRDEVAEFAYREVDLLDQNEKLKDEVESWKQRHENLISNLSEDFKSQLAK
jgi:hypothetical protein